MHIHVSSPEGEAKFWLEPAVTLCDSYKISPRTLRELQDIIESRKVEIIHAWKKHFKS